MQREFCRLIEEQQLVRPGNRVLVALSGGADSVALLHLLHAAAPSLSFSLVAAHLDHGIRQDSARDAEFAAVLCARLDVPLVTERVDLPGWARQQRCGLEEAGRLVRREFLRRIASQWGCEAVALGHHRGDQAETFLHRLLRGSALSGLAGMATKSDLFIRPLLPFSRSRLRRYLAEHQIEFREDPSNKDPAFTRNRIRHALLPQLAEYNPRIEEHLGRLCGRIGAEEDFWRQEVARAMERICRADARGVHLEVQGVLSLHPALRPRVVRQALLQVRGGLEGIAASHLDAVLEMAAGGRPQAEAHLPGAWVGRRYQWLWLRKGPPAPVEPFSFVVDGAGIYPLPDGARLGVALDSSGGACRAPAVEFDGDRVSFPLELRNFRPGDRFRPFGAPGGRKLKAFFIDERIPREERARLPLLVGSGEVLWVVGLRRCQGLEPVPGGRVLKLWLEEPENGTNGL